MKKRKSTALPNRIDENGETILASEGVDLDNLDLESMVEKSEEKTPRSIRVDNSGAKVTLILKDSNPSPDPPKKFEYNGKLVGLTTTKAKNVITMKLSLEHALELSDLLGYTGFVVEKLDIRYISGPPRYIQDSKKHAHDHNLIHLDVVEISEIKEGIATCILQLSNKLFNSNMDSWENIFKQPIGISPQISPYVTQPAINPWISNPNTGEKLLPWANPPLGDNWTINDNQKSYKFDTICDKTTKLSLSDDNIGYFEGTISSIPGNTIAQSEAADYSNDIRELKDGRKQ